MRKVVLDIETLPCHPKLKSLLPPITPPENLRDEDALDAWQTETLPGLQEDQFQRTALDWTLGRIACVGLLIADEVRPPREQTLIDRKEAKILHQFWKTVREEDSCEASFIPQTSRKRETIRINNLRTL